MLPGFNLTLGFTHILPHGLDHMLFVLGIYLLSGHARSVLCQVSAFTAAHSMTLGLSLYGVVSMPSKVVEPLIAVSIAYVAVENIFVSKLKAWRVALVFAFGLLHGMGFAGALKDVGLPRSEFLTALETSRDIFFTTSEGVAAGATMPTMLIALTPGTVSATTGYFETRSGPSNAITLIFPASMSGITA